MNKLKQYWGYVVAAITGIFGVVLFVLTRRGDKIEKLKTEIALAKTDKQADLLEVQINDLKSNKQNLVKESQELDKALKEVDTRRVEIKEEAKNLTNPKDIAKYWENN